MKVLLKLGGIKHLNENRWQDALKYFDKIICLCLYNEETLGESNRIEYIRMKRTIVNRFLVQTMRRIRQFKFLIPINCGLLYFLRVYNTDMIKRLNASDYTHILSSYCDYDSSDILTLMVKRVLKKEPCLIRSYKETRPSFNYFERECFRISDMLVFNTDENKEFFINKYGKDLFNGKKIVTGWDENVLTSGLVKDIKYMPKFSEKDGKMHAVILAGRVFSSPKQSRSGARLYYLDLIKALIADNIVVHLHTNKIIPDKHGVDQYAELEKKSNGMFSIEPPLDMRNHCAEACSFLSQYDYGVLHNFMDGSNVSVFDKINIPHRFYEYEAAHVIPILKKDSTIVLQKMFVTKKCGCVYEHLSDLYSFNGEKVMFYIPTYSDYIKEIILGKGDAVK